MTREKEIRKEAIEVTHFAQFGHSGRDMVVAYDAFIFGAQWADTHPNPNTIKRIFKFALEKTNLLVADNLESIDWEVLIKKAME